MIITHGIVLLLLYDLLAYEANMNEERDINDPQYKAWRTAVFSRDNGICRVCGKKGEEVHHIVAWAKDPSQRFNIENGITLCKACHEKTASYYKPKAISKLKSFFKSRKSVKSRGEIIGTSNMLNLEDASTPYQKAQLIEILMDNMKKRYIPEDAVKWYKIGIQLNESGDSSEALKYIDKALEIDDTYAEAWNEKGRILHSDGMCKDTEELIQNTLERAIECFDKALATHPYYIIAWMSKGEVLLDIGKYEEAVYSYDKVLEIYPEFEFALYYKGCALRYLKRYEESINVMDKLLLINSASAKYLHQNATYQKGLILQELGQIDEANRLFDEAN